MTKATMSQIKKLRSRTKAGVMDAKKALEASNGNMKQAAVWLKKKGLTKAAKKASRETSEGRVEAYIHTNGKIGALVKLSCETDFVARTKEFQTLARELAMQVASMQPKDVDALLSQDYIRDTGKTVEEMIKEAIAQLGENIKVEKITYFTI